MLSALTEYLLSLERPGGGRLLLMGAQQMLAVVPPNVSFTLEVVPGDGEYAYLVYFSTFDQAMVPEAFLAYAQQYGARPYEGVVVEGFTRPILGSFIVLTRGAPCLIRISNLTSLNQFYAGLAFWLTVASEEDYAVVQDALRRYITSVMSEEMLREIRNLMARLARLTPPPVPSLGTQP